MYYGGDLQSGIAKAVEESKSVVCFIVDGGDESTIWDEEWLHDHNLPLVLDRKAVTMMFARESDEAGFLDAFCPITTVPFLAVIHQGQVIERLTSGISKNAFTQKLLLALVRPSHESQSQATASSSSSARPTASAPALAQPDLYESTASPTPQSVPATPTTPSSLSMQQDRTLSPSNQADLQRARSAERRTKRQEDDAISGAAEADTTKKLANHRSYAEEQVIRKRNAKEDLDRIRKKVEYDKQARRERNEYSRAAAAGLYQDHESEISLSPSHTSSLSTSGRTGLQVRLLDGSAIRSTFEPSTKLSEVRQWLDSNRTDGDHPYTLKQLMTPAPSRPINDEDRGKSLDSLGLHPSATLVMSPLQGLAAAYQQSPVAAAQTIAGLIWSYIVAAVLRVVSMIKTFLGLGERPQQDSLSQATTGDRASRAVTSEGTSTGTAMASSDSGIRIRSLKDQRRGNIDPDEDATRSEHQLYNGGGLNFEPRRKDEDDDIPKAG